MPFDAAPHLWSGWVAGQQPHGPLAVNHENPLARNLRSLHLMYEGGDIVSGQGRLSSIQPKTNTYPGGRIVGDPYSAGVQSGGVEFLSNWRGGAGISFTWSNWVQTGTNNTERLVFEIGNPGFSTNSGVTTSTTNAGRNFNTAIKGDTAGFALRNFTTPFAHDTVQWATYVIDGGGVLNGTKEPRLYINGELFGTGSALTDTYTFGATPRIVTVGYRGSGTFVMEQCMHSFMVHDVVLRPDEIRALHSDPYQVLKPAVPTFDLSLLTAAVAPSVADYTMAHKILNFGYMGRRY